MPHGKDSRNPRFLGTHWYQLAPPNTPSGQFTDFYLAPVFPSMAPRHHHPFRAGKRATPCLPGLSQLPTVAPLRTLANEGRRRAMTQPLDHHAALIYAMVTMSAVDRAMSDAE